MADEDTMMSSDMTSYQKWEHGMIEDISHDTDALAPISHLFPY